jgi:hypothetical protein
MSIVHGYRTLAQMAEVLAEDVGLAAFLYAGLLWQEPRMTIEDACDLIDHFRGKGGSFIELARAIGEGLVRAGYIAPLKNGADTERPLEMAAETPEARPPNRLTS